jgi:hypothetical protein
MTPCHVTPFADTEMTKQLTRAVSSVLLSTTIILLECATHNK